MANPLWVMEHANLFCGSAPTEVTASNHLALVMVQLPSLEMQFVDHRAGGAPVSMEVDVIQTRMECRFEMLGIAPQVMELMGRYNMANPSTSAELLAMQLATNDFHIFGHVRNYATGNAIQAVAYMRGQLGHVEMQAFRNGGPPMITRYTIRGIVKYKFELGGEPIYNWDFYENIWSIGGFDQNGGSTLELAPQQPKDDPGAGAAPAP
jgi:phage tail tube protein FII